MALTKKISVVDNFNRSADFENAYIKVTSVNGGKDVVVAGVAIYAQDPKLGSVVVIKNEQHKFTPDMNGANFIAQAYKHLKTLADYSDAKDC
jgi:hypothetical protein